MPDELAGLQELILQYGAACRAEGVAMAIVSTTHSSTAAAVNALAQRIQRRVRRLEHLGHMGGIEPSDVRAALVGTWRI